MSYGHRKIFSERKDISLTIPLTPHTFQFTKKSCHKSDSSFKFTEAEVGKVYTGKVTRLMNFGAFVEILPGKEGLVHISQLSTEHVEKVEDVVSVGDEIVVKVTEIDNKGRINLSRKAVLMKSVQK